MSIDAERLAELLVLLPQYWIEKDTASRKQVQSLIGLLSFVAKCVWASRLFLSRMLGVLKFLPDDGKAYPISYGFN